MIDLHSTRSVRRSYDPTELGDSWESSPEVHRYEVDFRWDASRVAWEYRRVHSADSLILRPWRALSGMLGAVPQLGHTEIVL